MKLQLFLNLTIFPFLLTAQPDHTNVCAAATAQAELHANNVRALFLNGGDMFWDFNDARHLVADSSVGEAPTIFAAALWLGGVDPGGNLKLAAQDYRPSGRNDYWPGTLDSVGLTTALNCANWDRIFKVTAAELAAFQAALPLTPAQAAAEFPNVMGWPAAGNPYFEYVAGFALPAGKPLAPFHDADADGVYDPLGGDHPAVDLAGHPAVVPTEMLWMVFNDEGGGQPHWRTQAKAIQAEVQLTAWAFHAPDIPVLHNTIFTRHRIANHAAESIDSLFAGLWVDFDLGCPYDDYIGSRPGLSSFFVYNQDAVDGQPGVSCDGYPTFGDNPPTQSVTLLNASLNHFTYYNNPSSGNYPAGMVDPDQPNQFYNYLTGRWRDGTPMTAGGSGYQSGTTVVQHAFPGDPAEAAD